MPEGEIFMEPISDLLVHVEFPPGGDDEELARLTGQLRAQLLDLDVDSVDSVATEDQPAGAKGLEAVIGWLAVRLGKEGLRTVISTVVAWADRTGNTVEVCQGGDSLKIGRATAAQQEKIINDFLAKQHTTS